MMDGERAIDSATNYAGEVSISGGSMVYVKLLLIGALMMFSLKYNPKGMLPEVPARPGRPSGGDSE
jgi:ABC-type branched-subunit amino acid transport system permease subunit